MFHDHYVLTNDMYLPFCFFFMSCPKPPMGISGVGSFRVWSAGSLIIFQLFRCRNSALNMFFPTFLSGRHVFILGTHLDAPYIHVTPYVHTPQGFRHPPYVPHTPVHLYFLRGFCMLWGCRGLLTCWTPPLHAGHPLYGGASPYVLQPHSLVGFPVHMYVLGDVCM